MTVFPVVGRELRVASRRPWTYWSRLVAVGVGLMICSWFLMVRGGIGIQVTGEPVFYVASAMALGFGLLAGLLFSADSVSSEKRDGTLGLLFLTDLKGYDVTLGKLAATSLGAFYGLIAVMQHFMATLGPPGGKEVFESRRRFIERLRARKAA